MKTESHFLNWVYRSFKCLSSWPVSLLEMKCFLLLTYLLQGDEVHPVILSVQHMLGSLGGQFERQCKVTPSTVLPCTHRLPSLVLKVSLRTSWWNHSWVKWWKGCWSITQGTNAGDRMKHFLTQAVHLALLCSQNKDLKSSFTVVGWKKSFCHLCMTIYFWLHSWCVDLIPMNDILATIQVKFKQRE